ncbi:MAG: ATP-binding protein, partial [Acidimicrobiales bacterium]
MAAGSVVAPDVPTPGPAATGDVAIAVRKTVTVLFCDVVGSTAFAESVDPESARESMGRYHEMAQAAVEAHGGTVAKFIGDGVMALFGIPEVAEDDADRAVAAGLSLQAGFAGIHDYVLDRHGFELGLRVGINTGEVVISDDDADLVGDALNTAARLEAECEPGRVLVGEDTWRLTRSRVVYEVLGEVGVKGKADPVATFQVVDQPEQAVAEEATLFVGRADELAALNDAFTSTVRERVAKLAVVVGSPGVGKTRLAQELTGELRDDIRLFELRCERSVTSTFAPIADLLRGAAGIEADQSPEQIIEALKEALGPDAPDRERLAELLGSFVGASPSRSTEEAFFAVRRLAEVFASDAPVLLIIDDIQWAEPLFLDLVEHLVEWVQDAPIFIVALARPEIRDVRSTLVDTNRLASLLLNLEGLDEAGTEELAATMLGTDAVPPDLVQRLPESTQGNPLFVREFIRMLVEDETLAETADGWAMAIDVDAVEVPPTIQSLMASRVERMPVDERRVVELASVVGSEFPRGAVLALAPDLGRQGLTTIIDRLVDKDVFDTTGAYWGNEPVYRFHHVLIRDAAYRRLLKGTRADLHLQVGDWTAETASDLVGEHEATIGFHFEQAFRYRSELGLPSAEVVSVGQRAASLLETAARRSLERDDVASAAALSRRAVAALGNSATEQPELLLLACESAMATADVASARPLLEQLETIADDQRLDAWAACFQGELITLADPGQLSFADAAVAAAAERLEEAGDTAGVAKARQVRAAVLARLGRVGDCEAELDLALTAAREANDRRRVSAVLGAAPLAVLWGPSPVPRAGGRCLDVIRLLRLTGGSPAVEATSVRCQAVLETLRGKVDTARTMLDSARETAQELGEKQSLMETELFAGLVELMAGEAGDAEPHLRAAYEGLVQMGLGADASQAAAYLARALVRQDQLDDAETVASDADALAGQSPQTAITVRSAQAEILAARGDWDEALVLAEEAVALAAGTDLVVDHASACHVLARVRQGAGDDAGAAEARAERTRLYELKGATFGAVLDERDKSPLADSADMVRRGGEADGPTNDAVLRLQGILEATDRDELDGVLVLLDPDFVRRDRRPLVAMPEVGGREWAEDFLSRQRDEDLDFSARPLAVRGDRFSLHEATVQWPDGSVTGYLVVVELSVRKLVKLFTRFELEDYVDAMSELEHQYLESLDDSLRDTWAVMAASGEATNKRRWEDNQALYSPDFRAIDHRDMSWPELDRDEYMHRVVSMPATGRVCGREILAIVPGVALVAFDLTTEEPPTSRTDIHLGVVQDGVYVRSETFSMSDRDAALARFHELAAENHPLQNHVAEAGMADTLAASAPDRPLENAATRAVAWHYEWMNRGEPDRSAEVFAPDIRRLDRRRTVSTPELNGAVELVDVLKASLDVGYSLYESQTLAIRGDRLSLAIDTTADDAASTSQRLGVVEVNEAGLMTRIVTFGVDDLALAVEELDRWYVEGEGASERSVLEVPLALVRGLIDMDVGRAEEIGLYLADDVQIIDHQKLSWPTLDLQGVVGKTASGLELRSEHPGLMTEVLGVVGTRCAIARRIYRPNGANWETERDEIYVYEVVEETITAAEIFPGSAVDAALEQLAGSAGSASRIYPVENSCSRMSSALVDYMNAGDVDGVAEILAPDLLNLDRRSTVSAPETGSTTYLASLRHALEVGYTTFERRQLATRGDRLELAQILSRSETGAMSDRLVVGEVDEAGLCCLAIRFDTDDLVEALDELDRRYLEGDGAPDRSVLEPPLALNRALSAGDVDAAM